MKSSKRKQAAAAAAAAAATAAAAGDPHHAAAPAAHTELAKLLSNRPRALAAFEDAGFDPGAFLAAYLGHLSEKAVDNARHDLGDLAAAARSEVAGVVAAHHGRFLQACAGVEALEDQAALLRNYVNGMTALVGSIKAAARSGSGPHAATAGSSSLGAPRVLSYPQSPLGDGSSQAGGGPFDAAAAAGGGSSVIQELEASLEALLQELDLASAARDMRSAVAWLEAADSVGSILDRDAAALVMEVDDFPGWRHGYDAALGLRKQALVAGLQRQLADATASPGEVAAAAASLTDLVGRGPALQAMLACYYSRRIRLAQAALVKQHTAGSDPSCHEFAGRLVQRTLLTIAAAGDGLVATFGPGPASASLGSTFTVWAGREARVCAGLLRQHVLAPAAAASTGLATAVQVVSMALVLCAMLEDSHGISLTPVMTAELWPSIDAALRRGVKRAAEELRMAAAEEVDALVAATLASDDAAASGLLPLSVPGLVSCRLLADEVAGLAALLSPIATPQLAVSFKKALAELCGAATQTITATLKAHAVDAASAGVVSRLLPGVMEGLASLIEEGLPAAVAPFADAAGPVLDARALDRSLNDMWRAVSAAARGAKGAAGGGGGGGGSAAAHKAAAAGSGTPAAASAAGE